MFFIVDILVEFVNKVNSSKKSSHKEHKGREDHEEERGGYCSRVMRELYDKITDKNS